MTTESAALLSNIGVGLRIASSRAEKNSILHIDFAVPLEREEDVGEYQFLVTGKTHF